MPNPEITFDLSSTPQASIATTLTVGTTVAQATDTTLSNAGFPADAKATGDRFATVEQELADVAADVSGLETSVGDIEDAIDGLIPKTDIDTTLSVSGKVADAKVTGDAIDAVIPNAIDTTLSISGKVADAAAVGDAIADAVEDITTNIVYSVENILPDSITHNVDLSGLMATTLEVQNMIDDVIAGR